MSLNNREGREKKNKASNLADNKRMIDEPRNVSCENKEFGSEEIKFQTTNVIFTAFQIFFSWLIFSCFGFVLFIFRLRETEISSVITRKAIKIDENEMGY